MELISSEFKVSPQYIEPEETIFEVCTTSQHQSEPTPQIKPIENLPRKVFTSADYKAMGSPEKVVIPFGFTEIGKNAFYFKSLTSITIPNSVTVIGDQAFSNCESLTSIAIPDSVTVIGEYAFSYCKSLTSINISNKSPVFQKLKEEYGKIVKSSSSSTPSLWNIFSSKK